MASKLLIKRGDGAPVSGSIDEYELVYDYTNNQLYTKVGSTITAIGAAGAVDSISNFADNRVLTASDSDSIVGESNLTFSSLTLQIPSASGKVSVDTLVGYSNNTNTLLFNDDQTSANNQVTLQSINHINIMTDGNNNGTGNFKVWNGSYDVDTADLAFQVNSSSDATFYGDVTLSGTGDLTVPGVVKHTGDSDTYIFFTNDRIRLYAGGNLKLDTDVTYLTSSSALPAANLTGTIDADRIPSLATTKITSGTFDSARMPATFGQDSVTSNDITSRIESGFHETASGTTGEGFPITNNSYQHILAVTHSNNSNYYSMQIGGSFYDQNFYGRKTNGSGTTSWLRFITTADEGSGNGFDADTLDGVQGASFLRSDANDTCSGAITFTNSAGIYINDTNTNLDEGNGDSLRVTTDSGWLEVGSQNSSWGHIQTDRPKFYFNKQIAVDTGIISSYDEDLSLQRVHDSTSDRVLIQSDRIVLYVDGQEKIRAVGSYNYIPQKIYGGDGSASAPMYNFWNDSNTGMFRYGTDQLGFTTAGTTRMVLTNDGPDFINTSGLYIDNRRFFEMRSNSSDRGSWNPIVSSIRNSGIQRHFDEEFAEGSNGVNLYNNAGGSNLVVSRITASDDSLVPPNKTGVVMKVAYNGNGTTSPNFGGIYQTISSEENHTFVQIFQAKLPSDRYYVINENPQGTNNTSYWLTDHRGTGKWEWYARVSHCGDSGSFSSGGHISVAGGSDTAFNWYIASMTQYDVTESPYNYTSAGKGSSGQLLKADGDGTYSWQSQGGGSNLDADKLDGLQSSQFLRSDTSDSVGGDLDLGSGNVHIKKTAGNNTNNYAAVEVYSAGTADNQAAIAIQQQTSEGDTIIFADFEPHVEWGISAENGNNRIDFTGGSSSPSLGTKTFKNNSGNDRTAYRKMSVRLDNGNVDIAGNLTVANGSAYAGDSTSGVWSTGSWAGDLTSNGWERVAGVSHDGGEIALVEKNAQMSVLVDGSYFAYEAGTNQGGGFYSSTSSNYANAPGIVASNATLLKVCQADGGSASLQSTGDLIVNSGFISGVGSADMQIRRTTNSDDRIVIEASETKIYGDAVERVRFGSYGIRNNYGGSAGTPSYSFISDTNTGIYSSGADSFNITTGGSERTQINSLGVKVVNGALGVNVTPNGTDGRIDASNDVVAFSTSDKRLKENIKPLDSALDKVLKINGVEFDWKELTEEEKKTIHGNEGHDVGVIAQEVEKVMPEVVTTRDSGYKAVKYEKLIPLLIESIKELKEEVNGLKVKLGE